MGNPGKAVSRAFTPPGTGGLEAAAERSQQEAQAAIDAANQQAQAALATANNAIATLNQPATPVDPAAKALADRTTQLAATAAKTARLSSLQDTADIETERLFRLYGARAAFRGGGARAPILGN